MTATAHQPEGKRMSLPATPEGIRAELAAQKAWRRKQSSSVMKQMAAKRIRQLETALSAQEA